MAEFKHRAVSRSSGVPGRPGDGAGLGEKKLPGTFFSPGVPRQGEGAPVPRNPATMARMFHRSIPMYVAPGEPAGPSVSP
jgi:hypothetical protein